jgi:hypothetical protein
MKHIEYKVKVYADGSKVWWLNDECHREDGPAIESASGFKQWFLNGKCHREDGPAIEWADGDKEWFRNGKKLTEKQFNKKMKKPCKNKVVEIDGVKYKLTVLED